MLATMVSAKAVAALKRRWVLQISTNDFSEENLAHPSTDNTQAYYAHNGVPTKSHSRNFTTSQFCSVYGLRLPATTNMSVVRCGQPRVNALATRNTCAPGARRLVVCANLITI